MRSCLGKETFACPVHLTMTKKRATIMLCAMKKIWKRKKTAKQGKISIRKKPIICKGCTNSPFIKNPPGRLQVRLRGLNAVKWAFFISFSVSEKSAALSPLDFLGPVNRKSDWVYTKYACVQDLPHAARFLNGTTHCFPVPLF